VVVVVVVVLQNHSNISSFLCIYHVIYVTMSLLEQKNNLKRSLDQMTFFVQILPMHLFCNCSSHTALFEDTNNSA